MDGGATFELPVSVATTTGDTLLECGVVGKQLVRVSDTASQAGKTPVER